MAQGDELELNARGTVVFDVDGTLTRTHELDEAWYRVAIREVLGVEEFSTDWSSYRHSTDRSIVREIGERHRGREASPEEGEQVLDAYAALLADAGQQGHVQPVDGARSIVGSLVAAKWGVAIATGGWSRTARLKLDHAGIECAGVAFASADDADPRERIIQIALGRAGHPKGTPVVYVGDGRWDLLAAQRLQCGFVGLAEGDRAGALRAAGATLVTDGYRDVTAFLRLVERAGLECSREVHGQEPARSC